MLFSQGRFEEAIESWNRTIAIQPDLFRAYNNRAAAYVQLGELYKAKDDYEKNSGAQFLLLHVPMTIMHGCWQRRKIRDFVIPSRPLFMLKRHAN